MLVVAMRRQSCKPKVFFPSWFRFFVLILFIAENAHSQMYVLPNIENNFKAAFFKIGNFFCETNFQSFLVFLAFLTTKINHFEAHIIRVEIQMVVWQHSLAWGCCIVQEHFLISRNQQSDFEIPQTVK